MYRVSGSGDFVAVARSVYMISQHPDDENLRIFSAVKSNLSRPAPPLAFQISEKDGLQWSDQPVSLTAKDLLLSAQSIDSPSQLEEAVEFLREILKERPVPAQDVIKESEEIGISYRTLMRAKSRLKIISKRIDKGPNGKSRWEWKLPKNLNT